MRKTGAFSKVYFVLLFSFLYIPIAVLIVYSFNANKSFGVFTGFTLDWYRRLFNNSAILSALGLSAVVALLSSSIATILGTMASVGITRMKKGPRALIMNVTYMPIVNPEIITGISLMLLFVAVKGGLQVLSGAEGGALGWLADRIIGFPSLIISHIAFNVPYVIFNVTPKLRQMDVRLYEAALDLGCNERQAFFKVVLPEIMPAIISSFLICLTYSFDDFTISYFNSGNLQTLPIVIYSMTRRNVSPQINALSTILFAAILSIIIGMNIMESRQEKKRRRPRRYT